MIKKGGVQNASNEDNPVLGTTQMKYMEEHGFVMLVGTSDAYTERMEYFRQYNPLLIYSMWNGYLDEKGIAFNPSLRALYDKWPRYRAPDVG